MAGKTNKGNDSLGFAIIGVGLFAIVFGAIKDVWFSSNKGGQ